MSNDQVFIEVIQRRLKDFSVHEEYMCGYVEEHGYPELLNELKTLGYSYSIRKSELNKGNNALLFSFTSSNSPDVHFFGSPFISLKRITLQCMLGPNNRQKKVENEANHDGDHPTSQRKRFHITNTKKIGCPATILVKSIKVYNEYVIDDNSSKLLKQQVLQKLREDLQNDSPPQGQIRYYIKVVGNHIHPTAIAEMNERIHPKLVGEIYRLVDSGIASTRDIEIYLRKFTETLTENKTNLFNRAYHPSKDVIYTHIYRALFKSRETKIDQEVLGQEIEKWKGVAPEDNFFYRPYGEEGTLLFCHTTSWQKYLLQRYGTICLLDATYRTMKYALPLFFLCVKTNVGYSVVSTFIVQAERKELVIEALFVLKGWCPDWRPQFFMTDFSEVEIGALEHVFPQSTVYLCAFHREQAWQRWLKKSGNIKNGNGEDVLLLWRAIADSLTEEDFQHNVDKFNSLDVDSNAKAITYFVSQWLPQAHRWAYCFSAKDYVTIINTNNGVEAQNKVLKYSYLCHSIDKTLSGILRIIIEFYLPDMLVNYSKKNCIVKSYNSLIPIYLHNRPYKFVKHIMARIASAINDVQISHITEIVDGIFSVKSSDCTQHYCVNFDLGTCSCIDFLKTRLPCKHFCAVIQHFPTYSFDRLPDNYINSPFFTLDPKFTSSIMEPQFLVPTSISESQTLVPKSQPLLPTVISESPIVPSESSKQSELLQRQLRECAKYISDVSYMSNDVDSLQSCLKNLEAVCVTLTQKLPSTSGLPVLPVVTTEKSSSNCKYKPLPPRKRKCP